MLCSGIHATLGRKQQGCFSEALIGAAGSLSSYVTILAGYLVSPEQLMQSMLIVSQSIGPTLSIHTAHLCPSGRTGQRCCSLRTRARHSRLWGVPLASPLQLPSPQMPFPHPSAQASQAEARMLSYQRSAVLKTTKAIASRALQPLETHAALEQAVTAQSRGQFGKGRHGALTRNRPCGPSMCCCAS